MKLSIKNRGGCTVLRLSFLTVLLFLGLSPARAQEFVRTPSESSEPNVSERVRLLESELERQNTKLDQLQKTLLEQQATIQALLDKLSAPTGVEQVRKGGLPPPTGTAEATSTVAVTPEQQTPTVEQRLTKLEGQALRIGPIKVSGDF